MANINKYSKNHLHVVLLPPIPLTVSVASLNKVSSQRILGITIDNNLSFRPHIENITNKCKRAYNRLTLFPDMRPDLVI